jgi:hypothetical protein
MFKFLCTVSLASSAYMTLIEGEGKKKYACGPGTPGRLFPTLPLDESKGSKGGDFGLSRFDSV